MPVPITPEIEQLVESLYESGGFDDRTQVLSEALRLLQRRNDIARKVGIRNSDPAISGK